MRPTRETTRSNEFAYFVSTQTAGRKPFFRHDRWARLMFATINHYTGTGYQLHAFVIMPDHLHLLITPVESAEKSVQLIKGGFSFRAKRDLEWNGEIWQPGFTDHRIRDEEDWKRHLECIRSNPLEAKLVEDIALYEFMGFPCIAFPRGLKPSSIVDSNVRAKQAAEKLTFSKGAKNGSCQDALRAIREGWLMVLHPPNLALSLSIRSFSAACKARTLQTPEPTARIGSGAAKAVPFQSTTSEKPQEVEKVNATQK
jgi:putative transposase